jgi:HEAT repeat protein
VTATEKEAVPMIQKPTAEQIAQLRQTLRSSASQPEDRYRAIALLTAWIPLEQCRDDMFAALNDDDSSVRAIAAKRLGELPENCPGFAGGVRDAALAALNARMPEPDPDARFEIARALVRWGDCHSAIFDALLQLADDPQTDVAMLGSVVELFRDFPDQADTLLSRLTGWLEHDRADVREAAAVTAAGLGPRAVSTVMTLVDLLEDECPFVRDCSAKALGAIGVSDEPVLAGLHNASSDEDPEVAASAARSIEQIHACRR